MYSLIYGLFALAHLLLTYWLYRIYKGTGVAIALALLIPQFGLVYDNGIVAIGQLIGFGEALKALNWPRFWIHWIFGAWLIIGAGAVLRLADFQWAKPKWVMATFCLLTVALIGYDLKLFWTTSLYPVCELDLVRYSTASKIGKLCSPDQPIVKSEFPLASATACLVVIFAGAVLMIRRKFPWMFLGGVVMFFAATPPLMKLKLDQLGEILITGGVIWAIARFAPQRRNDAHA